MRFSNDRPFLAAMLLLISLLIPAAFHSESAAMDSAAPNILRLHVIANSDSNADQAVKLAVRDALLSVIEPGASAAAAKAFLLNNGALLQKTAEDTLKKEGFHYGAQLMLGTYPFPDRTYAGKTYPAGDYEALRVVLGRGEGQNWWCVLFPPLCIVSEGAMEADAGDQITFESSILNLWRKIS